MSINTSKLENVRSHGGKTTARCPACAEAGADKSGEHLVILESGKWGCIANAGDAGKEHRRRIAQLAGDGDGVNTLRPLPPPKAKPACKPAPRLPELRIPLADKLRQIAAGRGWHTADGLDVLVERGLLLVGEIYDDGTTHAAWVATDPSRANAQARKFDRGVWTGIGGKKAKSLAGTTASRCIGASVIGERPEVWLMEGTPDLCAAPIVARLAGLDLNRIAFVCITGTGNSIHADDLPHFKGKRITIAVHNDADHGKGAEAATRWADQLYRAGAASVAGFKFADGTKDLAEHLEKLAPQTTPPPAGHCPNCWTRRIVAPIGGPTCSCRSFTWPTWTPEQITAASTDRE